MAGLTKPELLPIDVPSGTQPCETFGVHPSWKTVRQLYEDGDASFVANVVRVLCWRLCVHVLE